jgi:hypothetical protein
MPRSKRIGAEVKQHECERPSSVKTLKNLQLTKPTAIPFHLELGLFIQRRKISPYLGAKAATIISMTHHSRAPVWMMGIGGIIFPTLYFHTAFRKRS